jgi:hypothetical protein
MGESELQHAAFDGVTEYVVALDTLCELAHLSLFIFENDFDSIGFNSETRYNTLRHFLLSNQNARLHLLAHDPQPLIRFCPRMMMLLRQFGHNMQIYQTPSNLRHLSAPFAVADTQHFIRRFHFDDTRGIFAQNDPQEAIVLKSRFEEMWASSRPCATTTTLGL